MALPVSWQPSCFPVCRSDICSMRKSVWCPSLWRQRWMERRLQNKFKPWRIQSTNWKLYVPALEAFDFEKRSRWEVWCETRSQDFRAFLQMPNYALSVHSECSSTTDSKWIWLFHTVKSVCKVPWTWTENALFSVWKCHGVDKFCLLPVGLAGACSTNTAGQCGTEQLMGVR